MNSAVLACNYAISGPALSDLTGKASPVSAAPAVNGQKLPVIRAQQPKITSDSKESGRRAALLCLAATLFTTAAASNSSSANAGVIDDYLEKSKANKVTRFVLFLPGIYSSIILDLTGEAVHFISGNVRWRFIFKDRYLSHENYSFDRDFLGGLGIE